MILAGDTRMEWIDDVLAALTSMLFGFVGLMVNAQSEDSLDSQHVLPLKTCRLCIGRIIETNTVSDQAAITVLYYISIYF